MYMFCTIRVFYTIRVWYNFAYHTRMVWTIHIWYNFTYHTHMVRVRTIRVCIFQLSAAIRTIELQLYCYSLFPIASLCLHAPPIDSTIDYMYAYQLNVIASCNYIFFLHAAYSYSYIIIYLKFEACMALNYSIICPA